MAGFSESNREQAEKSGIAEPKGNMSEADFSKQFLSRVWADLGWNGPDQKNAENQSAGSTNRKEAASTLAKAGTLPEKQPVQPSDKTELPALSIPSDSSVERQDPPPESSTPRQIFELRNLDHRAGNHSTPDAEVRLPANFDPTKPVHLVIYNHGWGSNAQSAFRDNKLDDQMAGAPANTVLIVPEWQRNAGANSGDQGNFQKADMFKDMLQEIFSKTPGLQGKTLSDVDSIGIFAHSAGYGPAETEIYKNGLSNKVTSITLLDSLYDNYGFDNWIKQNAGELKAGTKQFYNFFSGTSNYSKQLAGRVKEMLPGTSVLEDYNNGGTVMDAATLAGHSVVFKYSSATVDGVGAHLSMPHLYVGPVETAARAISDQNK